MKKLFLSFVIIFISAGCSKSIPAQNPVPAAVQTNNDIQTSQVIPKGAESNYRDILNAVMAKCGNNVELAYYFTLKSADTNNQQTDSYTFTAGNCGSAGQIINILYKFDTQQIIMDGDAMDNPNNILRPLPLADWNLNYSQAIKAALDNGGQTFLNNNPGSTIPIAGLAYKQNLPFEWQVEFKSADGSKKLNIFIDPKTGNVISQQ